MHVIDPFSAEFPPPPEQGDGSDGGFGRMFPDCTRWTPAGSDDEARERAIVEFARERMGPRDELSQTPAGYTYFGQFISHDMNFDAASRLDAPIALASLRNFRTPSLDLDSLYRGGPQVTPYLYKRASSGRMTGYFDYVKRCDDGLVEFDLRRKADGIALIGDARNDETIILGQLHVAFLRFHNAVLARIANGNEDTADGFAEARRIVRWTYQYVVWNDWLRNLVPKRLFRDSPADALAEFRADTSISAMGPEGTSLPIEFSFAAMRFGHSTVRETYDLNDLDRAASEVPLFAADGNDLRGRRMLPSRRSVQWNWFVDFDAQNGRTPASTAISRVRDASVRVAHKIDPHLSSALSHIPDPRAGNLPLAQINLRRGWRAGLPAASEVAIKLGENAAVGHDITADNLWYFVLYEAERYAQDQHEAARAPDVPISTARSLTPEFAGGKLGPVGARIVLQTVAEVLDNDANSYVSESPGWHPGEERVLNDAQINPNDWQLRDILRFAKVPIARSDFEAS